ncbi:MAG: glycosyl hydrolase family 17 protein [Pseudomonadota bacterium]
MSNRYQRTLSLAGLDLSRHSTGALRGLVAELLAARIHGLCFSPYIEGQGPGTQLSAAQIRIRLGVVAPYVRWIRTFSCTEGNELIPGIAAEQGLKSMVGVWLDDDLENNEREIDGAIAVAEAGHADILAVGNEVLLREDLSADQLIGYMERVKAAAPGVEVGYVDAYFKFVDFPEVTAACDVVLANCYPFWEGCPADHALLYMKEMYRRVSRAADGKRVIVSETGWPNVGSPEQGAVPSYENAVKYLVDSYQWAEEDGIDLFYFSAFDETWKVDEEGDVGAYWGIWDADGRLKYG